MEVISTFRPSSKVESNASGKAVDVTSHKSQHYSSGGVGDVHDSKKNLNQGETEGGLGNGILPNEEVIIP